MAKPARLFGVAPGVDFPEALVDGFDRLLHDAPPEDWARVTVILNTRRMERRVRDIFNQGPPRLLPRLMLLGDVEELLRSAPPPQPASGLRRRLSLAKLIQQLLQQRSEFGAQGSVFDLADSLAGLMDEMQGEGVAPDTVSRLDVSEHSEHFAQTQAFLGIAQTYLEDSAASPDVEARQRDIVQRLIRDWQTAPPAHPIVLAGSTGSRGTTAMLAEAIAQLPNGYVILPGFDFDLPANVRDNLFAFDSRSLPAEDHPQFRLQNMCRRLDLPHGSVKPWSDLQPHDTNRNRVVSLALRPAPVTDAWRDEGPALGDIVRGHQRFDACRSRKPPVRGFGHCLAS